MDLSDLDQTQAIVIDDEESDVTDELQPNEVQKPAGYLKVLLQKGLKESVHPIYDGDNIIGRNADSCHICIPSKSLSKEHACIQIINGSHLIFDKGSLNKTYRGKLLLSPEVRYELKNYDEITFADVRCVYHLPKEVIDTVADSGSETEDSDNLLLHHEVTLDDSGAVDKLKEKTDLDNGSNEDSVLPPSQVFAEKLERKSISEVLAKDTPEVLAGKISDVEKEDPLQTMEFLESESEDNEEHLIIKKTSGVVEETFFCDDSDPESSKDQEVLGVATQAYFNAECSDDTDEEVLKSDLACAATQAYTVGENNDETGQDGVIKCASTVVNNTLNKKVELEFLEKDSEQISGAQHFESGCSKRNKKEIHDSAKSITNLKVSELIATQIYERDEDSDSAGDYKLLAMSTLACDAIGGANSDNVGENAEGFSKENEPTQVFEVCPSMKIPDLPGENENNEMTSSPSSEKTKGWASHPVKSSSAESLSLEIPTQVLVGVKHIESTHIYSDSDETFDVRDAQTVNLDYAGKETVISDDISESKKGGQKGAKILDIPTMVVGETAAVGNDSGNESKAGRRRPKKAQLSNKLLPPISSSVTVIGRRLITKKEHKSTSKTTAEDSAPSSSDSVSCIEDNMPFEKSVLENYKKCGEGESELDAAAQDLYNLASEIFSPNTRKLKKMGLHLRKQSRTGPAAHDEPSSHSVSSDEPTQAYGIIDAGSTQVFKMDTEDDKETSKVDEPTQVYMDECEEKNSPRSITKDNVMCVKVIEAVVTQKYQMDLDGDQDVSRVDEPTQAYETDVDATQTFGDNGVHRSSKLEDPTQKYDVEENEEDDALSRSEKRKRSEVSMEVPDESFDDSDLEDQPLLRVNENYLINSTQQLDDDRYSEEENKEKSHGLSVKGQVSPPCIRNEDKSEVMDKDSKVVPTSDSEEVDKASDNNNDNVDAKVEEDSQTKRALFQLSKKGKTTIHQVQQIEKVLEINSALENPDCKRNDIAKPIITPPSPTRRSPRKVIIEDPSQRQANEKSKVTKTRGKRGKTEVMEASVEEIVNKDIHSLAPIEDFEPVVKKGKKVVFRSSPISKGVNMVSGVRSSRRSQVNPPQRSSPVEKCEPRSEKSTEHEAFTSVHSKDNEYEETASMKSVANELSNVESHEAEKVVGLKRNKPRSEKRTVQKESSAEKVMEMVTGPKFSLRGRRVSFQPAFLKDFETDSKNSNRGKPTANKNSPVAVKTEKIDDITANLGDESVKGKRRKTTSTAVEPTDDKEVLQRKTGRGRTKRGQSKSTESSTVDKNDANILKECQLDETELTLEKLETTMIESKFNEPKTAGTRIKTTTKIGKNSNGDVINVQNEEKQVSEKKCPENDGGANNAENLFLIKQGQLAVNTTLQAMEQDMDFKVSGTKSRRKSFHAQKSQTRSSQETNSKASGADLKNFSVDSIDLQVTAEAITSRGRPRKSEMMKADAKNDFSASASEKNVVESVSEAKPPMTPTSKRKASGRAEVAETPSKKSSLSLTPAHHKKEENAEHSSTPTLRKSTMDKKPKVMFTGVIDEQGEKIVKELGGEIASSIQECTHLVTDKIRRTVKFLSGLSKGLPIVSPQWLDSSKQAGTFLDSHKYIVSDQAMEKQYKFVLSTSISKATNNKVFQGYKVHVSKSVHPDPAQMQEILQCAGAKYLKTMPKKMSENTVVVSCANDEELCQPAIKAGIPVVEAEFVLTGILRQEVDFKSFSIFIAEISKSAGKKRSKKK